ncbi:MAG TPA: Gfo/Idh/MocA family oxidoreductase, partial [Pirellulaceae bacterium]
NPRSMRVVALADIRPSSVHRAFHGDWGGAQPEITHSLRPGLMQIYGWKSEDQARREVAVFEDYRELLKRDDVEAVIIALPLHLHAPAAIAALRAGKHVLTEKLMAHNIAQAKLMARTATDTKLHLATGHQRHYSILYDDAKHILQAGLIGQIHHIRAQWHRGNLPGKDSWKPPVPGGELAVADMPAARVTKGQRIDTIADQLRKFEAAMKTERSPARLELLRKQVAQWTAWDADKSVPAENHGYENMALPTGERSALEELVRWRLWERTGGGLMAELGSHQLDAASIFLSALRADGKKVHPLTIHAVGGRHLFPRDRDCEDHVYCMFEFPGPAYEPAFDVGYRDVQEGVPDPKLGVPAYDPDKHPGQRVVVTYSSINGNGWGGYGETVLGTKGTLILEQEQEIMLFKDSDTATRVGVKAASGGAALDTQASGSYSPLAQTAKSGPVSRGYREEMEHFAWCIRHPD